MKLKLTQLNTFQLFQVMRYGSIFLASIFVTHLLKSKSEVGEYETMLLYGSSFYFFWMSGILAVLFPIYGAGNLEENKKYFFNAFVLMNIFSVFFSGIMIFTSLYDDTVIHKDVFIIYGCYTCINAPTYLTEYIYVLEKKFTRVLLYGVVIFGLQVTVTCLPLLFDYTLKESMEGMLVFCAFKYVFILFVLKKYAIRDVNTERLKYILKRASPIIISLLLGGSIEYLNGYIIKYNFTLADFAVFRIGAREFPLFLIMANSLSNIMSGEIASHGRDGTLKEGLELLKKRTINLMHLLFPLAIALMLFSQKLFALVYPAGFSESYIIFNIFLLLIGSRVLFPQTVILGLQHNKYITISSALEIGINIIAAYFLMPILGIKALAWSTLIAYLAEKIILILFCYRLGIKLPDFFPARTFIIYMILVLAAFLFSVM